MPSFHHGLISRSSSTTLSVSHPQEIRDGSFEDMAIAQELLNQPRIPRSQTTLTGFLSGPQGLQISHSQVEYDGSKDEKRSRRALRTSNTWTSSSGEVLSDHDEIEDRTLFVAEYNRLALKHGVRAIVPDDFEANDGSTNASGKAGSWFTRKFLRRTSSNQSTKPDKHMRHRRSISDLSLRLKNAKKDSLKDKDLQELVRLCGLSLLYLPAEYAAGSLAVPTCFRATAQYLVQHAPSARGVFRIPGSHHVVAALYNHYCNKDVDGDFIAGTVRCPTVPEHIKCDVHDVASAFKKFLSGLPGGILGSLTLFDALISIQSQLQGDPELTRTKQSKVRARLIALAISTLRSQYRRDLICAVFGLLCMIGRAAETTRREDDKGRPLPTSDLMGYSALGIVFGPLLIGELLENYTMHLANPHGGLILLPISPPKSRKERQKKQSSSDEGRKFNTHVDKIKVANNITEMVITHWRDVVRHLRSIGALKVVAGHKSLVFRAPKPPFLRPSASDTFALRKPPDWDDKTPIRREGSDSPTPVGRVSGNVEGHHGVSSDSQQDSLIVRKQRSRTRPMSSQMLSGKKSVRSILSPTAEERSSEHSPINMDSQSKNQNHDKGTPQDSLPKTENTLPPPPPPFPLTRTPIDHSQYRRGKETSKSQEKSEETAHSESAHHKKGKLSKTPKSHDRKHKDRSKASEKSTESLDGTTQDHEHRNAHASRRSIESPAKLGGIDYSAQKALAAEEVFFHSPTRRAVKPQNSTSTTLRPQNPNIRITKASDVVPEGTVSAQLRRIAASEPGQQPGLRVPGYRRLSKTTHVEPIKKSAWAHIQKAVNDPLSRVSHEEDEASLATLAKAMESEEISVQDHAIPTKKDHLTRLSHEEDQAALVTIAQAMKSEENANKKDHLSRVSHEEDLASLAALARALDSQESSTGSDDPPKRPRADPQNKDSSPPKNQETQGPPPSPFLVQMDAFHNSTISIPVRRSHDLQKHSNSPSLSKKSPFKRSPSKIPEASKPIGNTAIKISPRPRGSSVKALAAKFDNPEPVKSPSPSPTRSPARSIAPSKLDKDGSPRRQSLVAPYTRNTPSPAKSQKSGKSGISEKTPQSIRNTKTVERQIQLESRQPIVEPRSSPAKNESPRRILKSSLNDSTPLRHVDRSVESMRSSGSFTVNATNPFSVSLKRVKSTESKGGPAAYTFDGPSSTPSSGRTLDVPDAAKDPPQVEFSQSIASNATERTLVTRPGGRPVSPLRDVLGISPNVLMPNSGSTTIPILGRSPSVLHSQITTLQNQISKKNEQLRQLRQQLEARSNLDVGTLSEQLREAKKELQVWKTRAETAERQVERLTKVQSVSRSTSTASRNVRQSSVDYSARMQRSSTEYDDGSKNSERIRKAQHGMDGATSSEFASEESNHTVIRDIRSVITGNEYSTWREQTMNALGSNYLPELE